MHSFKINNLVYPLPFLSFAFHLQTLNNVLNMERAMFAFVSLRNNIKLSMPKIYTELVFS